MKYNNVIEYKPKPMIIAICGKSATGKDTLAKWLVSSLKQQGYPAQIIVSDTTRPPRNNEINGIDYNFLTEHDFHGKINLSRYLEYSNFNGWLYGTDKNSISHTKINIGVFNPEGLGCLASYKRDYNIVCIYLKCNILERLRRSYKREHVFKKEYLRRAYVDYYDFKDIKKTLMFIPNHYIINTRKQDIQKTLSSVLYILKYKIFNNWAKRR